MASWMVHLRIADLLLGMIDGLDACQFAIGNVAPDSGIADKNGRFHPPKEVSHYRDRTIPPSTFLNKDNLFYKDYLAAVSPSDKSRFSFLLVFFLAGLLLPHCDRQFVGAASLAANEGQVFCRRISCDRIGAGG